VVLHLVDCSLLAPPRTGPDGQARYLMLESLREFGAQRLAHAGEQPGAALALTQYALQVAEQAAAGLQTSAGEMAAARWLDAEDATLHQALAWALERDQTAALGLGIALAPWWLLRGRSVAGYMLLRAAAEHASPDGDQWPPAQLWLGYLALRTADFGGALGHFTAVHHAAADGAPSPTLAEGLAGRASALRNLGRLAVAADAASCALATAQELRYPAGEALALMQLGFAASYADERQNALAWARQAQQINPASIPARSHAGAVIS
jgi:hypothetical protein